MREEDVTLSVKDFIENDGWIILGLNNPFSGKGIWIKPIGGFRGKGTLIPDIIAKKGNEYLIVEAYNKLKVKDISKLEKYSKPEYLNSIKNIFNETGDIIVKKALAYPYPLKDYSYPKDFSVFLVKKDLTIKVITFN